MWYPRNICGVGEEYPADKVKYIYKTWAGKERKSNQKNENWQPKMQATKVESPSDIGILKISGTFAKSYFCQNVNNIIYSSKS